MKKDLFGHKIKHHKERLEILLAKHDRDTLFERIERIKFVQRTMPRGDMLGSFESVFLYIETKDSFINGQFIATLMLAQSFIERVLQKQMENKGYPAANRGLKYIIKYCKDNQFLEPILINKIDKLRKIRNPFSHLKHDDYPYRVDARVFQEQKMHQEILQKDAEEAIGLMYTVALTRL